MAFPAKGVLRVCRDAAAFLHLRCNLIIDFEKDFGGSVPLLAASGSDSALESYLGGTGLGLNIAREALARSGGKLKFHPEHEGGAMFEIVFPAGPGH